MSHSGNWLHAVTRLAIFFRDEFRCVYCTAHGREVALTIDHIDGQYRDGTHRNVTRRRRNNRPDNLVTACRTCNSSRRGESVSAFCRRRGYRVSVVWRRINTLCEQDIRPYRSVARMLLERGLPSWLEEIRLRSKSGVSEEPCEGCTTRCPWCVAERPAVLGSDAVL